MNCLTLLPLLFNYLLLFIVLFKIHVVLAQNKCEILKSDGSTDQLFTFTIDERSPKGFKVTTLIVKHDSSVSFDGVTLEFSGIGDFKKFFQIENKIEINNTHVSFDLIVESEFDLYENYPEKVQRQKFNCQPNSGEQMILVSFRDVNEEPIFDTVFSNFTLFENFPINVPFSKLYSPGIHVSDKDSEKFGKLEFIVWEDDTFSTKSSLLRAEGEKLDRDKYLVNLYLMQFLNSQIKKNHEMILMAKDESGDATSKSATTKIEINVSLDPTIRLQPQFKQKTYSTIIGIKNKSIFGDKKLKVSIDAKISDGGLIQYEIDKDFSEFATSFLINKNTAEMEVIDEKPLVDEKLTSTVLAIRAISMENTVLSDLCLLTVNIVYLPEFKSKKISVFTSRTSTVGTMLWSANAGPFTTYSVNARSSYYDINSESGDLSIKNSLVNAVDGTVIVIASRKVDGKIETDQVEVTIHVVDNVESVTQLQFKNKDYFSIVTMKNKMLDSSSKVLTIQPESVKAIDQIITNEINYEIDTSLSVCADCFEINRKTAEVRIITLEPYIKGSLTIATLIIRAYSTENKLLSDSTSITIYLVDKPYFENKNNYPIYIPRDSPVKTTLWTAHAGSSMTYSLKAQNAHYDINPKTGELYIKTMLNLAEEDIISVIASKDLYGGITETDDTQITIRVVDNVGSVTHLQFEHKNYSAVLGIKNKILDGNKVLDISPRIMTSNSDVQYEIDEQLTEFSSSFSIDKTSAQVEITKVEPLVEKHLTKTTLLIRAISTINPIYSDLTAVSIEIAYKPKFEDKKYTVFVPRNSSIGEVVWTAQAGPFMTYSIKDSNLYYDVNSESGAVSIIKLLENAVDESLIVIASKNVNGIIETDQTKVEIHVVDNVESVTQLKFENNKYFAIIGIKNKKLDNNPILTILPTSIKAIDHVITNEINYEIDTSLSVCADCFEINRKTAEIRIISLDTLIKNNVTTTTVIIRAFSSENHLLSDSTTITIYLVDKPYFEKKNNYPLYIPRNSLVNTTLWTAHAGSFMTYSLKVENVHYDVNRKTGELYIKTTLDKAVEDIITVVASRNLYGGNAESDETQITLRIVDNVESITHLQFEHKHYSAVVGIKNKLLDSNKVLDISPKIRTSSSDVQYEIDQKLTEFSTCFSIDKTSAQVEIININPLVERHLTKTTLLIRAISVTNPIYSDVCAVSIQIAYKPKFENKNYSVFVPRNSSIGEVVWTAQAGPFMKYSIKDSSLYYDVNSESGAVSIINLLDNAVDKTLIVIASKNIDGRNETDQAKVEIHVVDNVESVTQLKFENKKYFAIIGIKNKKLDSNPILTMLPDNVMAISPVNNKEIYYEIVPNLTRCAECFDIDEKTAQVRVVNIDPLIKNTLTTTTTLIIRALSTTNSMLSDLTSVTVELVYKPYFENKQSYSLYIPRNSLTNTVLWTAHAGLSMTYSLKALNKHYDVDSKTGAVYIKSSLITATEDTLTIIASKEINKKTEIDQIVIHVVDNVESSTLLHFIEKKYSAVVDVKNKTFVSNAILSISPKLNVQINVNSKVLYKIDKSLTEFADNFLINETTAEIKIVDINSLIEKGLTKTCLFIRAISTSNSLFSDVSSLLVEFVYNPEFSSNQHSIYIPRNTSVGSVLWTAQAGPFVTYSVQDSNSFFELNQISGAISLKMPLKMAPNQVVFLNATDKGKRQFDQTQISINIVDNVESLTHLQFKHKKYSAVLAFKNKNLDSNKILEMSPNLMKATINDGSEILYEIDQSFTEFANSFSIDKISAQIEIIDVDQLVEKHLTRTTLFIRAISVSNPIYSDISVVSIQIVYKPKFENKNYSVFVPRNISVGTVLWTAQAGPFMTYSIRDQSGYFEINKDTGTISLKMSLERAGDGKVTVIASKEIKGVNETDITYVEIYILDKDVVISVPSFELKSYSAIVGIKNKKLDSNNSTLEILPKSIKAFVNDNSAIIYDIDLSLTKFANSFLINGATAQIQIMDIEPLVEKHLTQTTLIIRAFSANNTINSDLCTVVIRFIYVPKFQTKEILVFVPKNSSIDTILWTANAGPFVTYSLKDSSVFYNINKETGVLSVKTSLENAGDETVNVIATGEIGTDTAQITIHVLRNDKMSQIGNEHSEAECSIEENQENVVCYGLTVSPNDDYLIIKGNNDQNFKILNGQLLSSKRLDYEKNYSYFLILYSIIANKTLYVTVKVTDVNEPPSFETENQIFAIAPWIQPDGLITIFKANDADFPTAINAQIAYSMSCTGNSAQVFNLNPISGELKWVQNATEKVYSCNVTVTDKGSPALSDHLEIKIFLLNFVNVFSLKVAIKNEFKREISNIDGIKNEFRREISNIERELSDILEMQVVKLFLKPDLMSEDKKKIEYQFFAFNGDSALSFKEIEIIIDSKKEELGKTLGEYSVEPHNSLMIGTKENEKDQEGKTIAIISLSVVIGLMLLAGLGIIIYKKLGPAKSNLIDYKLGSRKSVSFQTCEMNISDEQEDEDSDDLKSHNEITDNELNNYENITESDINEFIIEESIEKTDDNESTFDGSMFYESIEKTDDNESTFEESIEKTDDNESTIEENNKNVNDEKFEGKETIEKTGGNESTIEENNEHVNDEKWESKETIEITYEETKGVTDYASISEKSNVEISNDTSVVIENIDIFSNKEIEHEESHNEVNIEILVNDESAFEENLQRPADMYKVVEDDKKISDETIITEENKEELVNAESKIEETSKKRDNDDNIIINQVASTSYKEENSISSDNESTTDF